MKGFKTFLHRLLKWQRNNNNNNNNHHQDNETLMQAYGEYRRSIDKSTLSSSEIGRRVGEIDGRGKVEEEEEEDGGRARLSHSTAAVGPMMPFTQFCRVLKPVVRLRREKLTEKDAGGRDHEDTAKPPAGRGAANSTGWLCLLHNRLCVLTCYHVLEAPEVARRYTAYTQIPVDKKKKKKKRGKETNKDHQKKKKQEEEEKKKEEEGGGRKRRRKRRRKKKHRNEMDVELEERNTFHLAPELYFIALPTHDCSICALNTTGTWVGERRGWADQKTNNERKLQRLRPIDLDAMMRRTTHAKENEEKQNKKKKKKVGKMRETIHANPRVGDIVILAHHPQGKELTISFGTCLETDIHVPLPPSSAFLEGYRKDGDEVDEPTKRSVVSTSHNNTTANTASLPPPPPPNNDNNDDEKNENKIGNQHAHPSITKFSYSAVTASGSSGGIILTADLSPLGVHSSGHCRGNRGVSLSSIVGTLLSSLGRE